MVFESNIAVSDDSYGILPVEGALFDANKYSLSRYSVTFEFRLSIFLPMLHTPFQLSSGFNNL